MKKTILFILLAALVGNLMAQSFANDQENLKKYWYYRQRLKENFIFMSDGNERGSNLPVDRIVPNVEGIDSEGNLVFGTVRYVNWDDCNGALPYYIMLLATEYKLLKKYANASNDNDLVAAETLHELQNAVNTIERLDLFVREGVVNNSPDGVFRRSDVCNLDNRVGKYNIESTSEFFPMVDHFKALNHNVRMEYYFSEPLWESKDPVPVDNSVLVRYNSQDNVLKFIEAEALAREMLEDYPDAYAVKTKLYYLTKLMIKNMYHEDEPRSFWDRDEHADENGFMNKTWYLKDPDKLSDNPNILDGLIASENGGAGDLWTYFTSYGYSKSSKRFGYDYKGTDLSWYLFKRAMGINYEQYSTLTTLKIEYSHCSPSYIFRITDVSGRNVPIMFPIINPLPWCWVTAETEMSSQSIHSEWFFRTLAMVNDISPSWILNSLFPKYRSTYKYLVNKRFVEQAPLDQLPLIWSILNNVSQISDDDRAYIGGLLEQAPACGPWNIGYDGDNDGNNDAYFIPEGSFEWSSPNRFVWPELRGVSDPGAWKRTGYYNGIDYMVLHNLYWLTKVESSQMSTTYPDEIVEDQPVDIISKSEHVYARNRVTLSSNFHVTANPDYKYVAGTASDMRRTSDADYAFTKVELDDYESTCHCEPIFKSSSSMALQLDGSEMLKSADKDNDQSGMVIPTSVTIYPNPAKEQITVTSNQYIQDVLLLNSTGKILLEFSDLNTNKHTFTIASLMPGLYMVKTTTVDGYEKVEKVLKKD